VFSALGCALSDIVYSHVKSEPLPLDGKAETVAAINRTLDELAGRARADMAASGVANGDGIAMRYKIEMRYQGQMNEVTLPWDKGRFEPGDLPALKAAFEALYQQRFGTGTIRPQMALELISFRAEAVPVVAKPPIARLFERETPREAEPSRRRRVWRHGSGWLNAGIHDFAALAAGARVHGPAVIERDNTTVWLPPESVATLDLYGNLLIDPGRGA
jgi:N-methylhydantoinase A/oxoprolinase/acetone carboxylase beta subunit